MRYYGNRKDLIESLTKCVNWCNGILGAIPDKPQMKTAFSKVVSLQSELELLLHSLEDGTLAPEALDKGAE
jgi:hypothetical protein